MWQGFVLSALFGGMTGAAEIISRYRDEPMRAVVNRFGLTYLVINGALSAAAFALLGRYADRLIPATKTDWLLQAILAGFGAMAIIRSKLFIFRTEDGKEIPIGPAIVIETFLRMFDRKIDRHRASARQRRVFESMGDIRDFERSAEYLTASLLSFQNLSQEEKQDIARVIEEYKQAPWPVALKSAALGMAFLTIAGEENFDQVINSLKSYLATLQSSSDAEPSRASGTSPAG